MIAGADVFLDTNVLIYAASAQWSEPAKWEVAHGLLTTQFGTSGQILAEFYANAIRIKPVPVSPEEARRWVSLLGRKPFVVIDERLILTGIDFSQRYQISYWDGAIIAAAERVGAKILYTEDLNHGQTYGSVQAINPFV